MSKTNHRQLVQPFLKWAGGKRQLLPDIVRHIPKQFGTYYEPFLGAGAVLFHLQPKRAVVNDINAELMNTYIVIRDDIDGLIADLKKHKNEKEYFYRLRNLDRQADYRQLSATQRASRLIYLNKTCYNGLFRVNRHGFFNVPFGRYKNPQIVNEPVLRAVHQYLNSADITLLNTDFEQAVATAQPGDFVYFDPPYDPVSDTSNFTDYSCGGFGKTEQKRLRDVFVALDRRGCKVLLSNSATDFIKNLYDGYRIVTVQANRNINSDATKRGKVAEVLIMNYDPEQENGD
ncbi:MAG: DNA adenine methylase [Bacillota bacterium]|nr:DNA methyltransferase [Bacillota bacterium]